MNNQPRKQQKARRDWKSSGLAYSEVIMNTKFDEGKLISGDEAKKAWANGETIEFHYADTIWAELPSCAQLSIFEDEEIKFRLKPRTITLNGIEVPAPFEPKSGDMVWCLNELSEKGYEARSAYNSDDFTAHIAYWRTEEEIKQVVAALRQVFGGSHDN
ncbi:hypothetical protein [Acinetobacter thermotolerans]|uniref:hypothetical protein n=1 Tax=Acinetobacter thermotolerans TaxID=3151487 RepID=UPI00325C06B9